LLSPLFGIAPAGKVCAYKPLHRPALRVHVRPSADNEALELGRKQARMDRDTIERVRQGDRFDASVANDSNSGGGDQHQRDHGQHQASG